MNSSSALRTRIEPVDGLRAIAVVGVIWFHVWQSFHNVSWPLVRLHGRDVNMNVFLSVGQTGVDLFFVISGFCMYMMYGAKQKHFSWPAYFAFLRLRWLRIAPAYYVSCLAVAGGLWVAHRQFPWFDLLTNITFTQHVVPETRDLVAPFWSLATEWSFYLLLPPFVAITVRWGLRRAVLASLGVCLCFRVADYIIFPGGGHSLLAFDFQSFILARLVEFVIGMVVASLYLQNSPLPVALRGWYGFLLACAVAVVGRVLMAHQGAASSSLRTLIFGVVGLPLLTFGYGLIVWNVVGSNSIFERLLSCQSIRAVGRWSYSMYLWHAWPVIWISTMTSERLGFTPFSQHVAFVTVVAVMLPVSWLSYTLFERPYFLLRARHRPTAASAEAIAV